MKLTEPPSATVAIRISLRLATVSGAALSGRIAISGTFSEAPDGVGAAPYIYAFSRSIPRVKTAAIAPVKTFPARPCYPRLCDSLVRRSCQFMSSAQATVRPAGSAPLLLAGPRSREEGRRVNLLVLCGLALAVGVMTGGGAVALRALIGLFHNAFYNGTLSIWYDANVSEGPSRFGDLVLLSPILGGLIVVFLVQRFAPEAKGHGVPEVMDAVFYKRGNIRGQVAIIKSLASALSIGSGAAVGREGPIIQIGAALGSAFAQAIGLSTWQKITLLSAGAGAGIAATFNTPLGGVLFALEILLPEVSNRTFLPVVIATGAATTIGRMLIGPDPAFVVPDIQISAGRRRSGLQEAIAFVAARNPVRGRLLGLHSPARHHGGRISRSCRETPMRKISSAWP